MVGGVQESSERSEKILNKFEIVQMLKPRRIATRLIGEDFNSSQSCSMYARLGCVKDSAELCQITKTVMYIQPNIC